MMSDECVLAITQALADAIPGVAFSVTRRVEMGDRSIETTVSVGAKTLCKLTPEGTE
jgi:hypothetical protein